MDIYKLPIEAAAETGYTHAVKVTFADLTETTANTAQTLEPISVTAGSVVSSCAMRLVTALEDASDAAFNDTAITVGDGSDVDRFLTSTQLNENGTEVLAKATANSVDTIPHAYVAADTVDIVVNSMTAKSLSDIDTGEFWVFLGVTDLDDQVNG